MLVNPTLVVLVVMAPVVMVPVIAPVVVMASTDRDVIIVMRGCLPAKVVPMYAFCCIIQPVMMNRASMRACCQILFVV